MHPHRFDAYVAAAHGTRPRSQHLDARHIAPAPPATRAVRRRGLVCGPRAPRCQRRAPFEKGAACRLAARRAASSSFSSSPLAFVAVPLVLELLNLALELLALAPQPLILLPQPLVVAGRPLQVLARPLQPPRHCHVAIQASDARNPVTPRVNSRTLTRDSARILGRGWGPGSRNTERVRI